MESQLLAVYLCVLARINMPVKDGHSVTHCVT